MHELSMAELSRVGTHISGGVKGQYDWILYALGGLVVGGIAGMLDKFIYHELNGTECEKELDIYVFCFHAALGMLDGIVINSYR